MTNLVPDEEYFDVKDKPYVIFKANEYSQWHQRAMLIDGTTYNCCEQYMMAEKAILFNDKDTLVKILGAKKPRMQKQLGREVKNFDENKWKEHCFDIVAKGNYYKFKQHPDLKTKLFTKRSLLIL